MSELDKLVEKPPSASSGGTICYGGDAIFYTGRRWLLRAARARCYRGRRRLLPRAVPAATCGVVGCYLRHRRLLQGQALAATGGGRLLPTASPVATRAGAGCYLRRRRLLPTASPAATYGVAGCYKGRCQLGATGASRRDVGAANRESSCFRRRRRRVQSPDFFLGPSGDAMGLRSIERQEIPSGVRNCLLFPWQASYARDRVVVGGRDFFKYKRTHVSRGRRGIQGRNPPRTLSTAHM
jgi:hypothetical protein